MIFLIFILWNVLFFGLLNSGFNYVNDLHQKEEKKKKEEKEAHEKKKEELSERALLRAAAKYSRFLDSEGNVDKEAVKRFLIKKEAERRNKIETINFEVIQ